MRKYDIRIDCRIGVFWRVPPASTAERSQRDGINRALQISMHRLQDKIESRIISHLDNAETASYEALGEMIEGLL